MRLLKMGNKSSNITSRYLSPLRGRYTPLFLAAEDGLDVVFKIKLDTGAPKPDRDDPYGRTLFEGAFRNGHGTVVYHMLATGMANVNSDEFDNPPFLEASAYEAH